VHHKRVTLKEHTNKKVAHVRKENKSDKEKEKNVKRSGNIGRKDKNSLIKR
jgi:hypothetical protein